MYRGFNSQFLTGQSLTPSLEVYWWMVEGLIWPKHLHHFAKKAEMQYLLTGEPSHLFFLGGGGSPNVPTHVDCSTNSHGFVFWHLCVYGIVCVLVLVSYWKWHLMMANNGTSRNSWDCKKQNSLFDCSPGLCILIWKPNRLKYNNECIHRHPNSQKVWRTARKCNTF